MGSFAGHLLPGVFFLIFGIRWTIELFKRYFVNPHQFQCSANFPSKCCPHVPLEGLTKMVCCTIGMIGEFATAYVDGKFVHIGNTQHMAMFFFFGLNGLVEMLTFYEHWSIPKYTDYASLSMAVFVEGLLFYFHLHGRSPLDIHVHMLLLVTIYGSFFAVLIEWYHQDNVLSVMFRCFCALMQGTWFIQIGFILYNPLPGAVPWADHDHDQMMIVTTMFCVHMALNLVFISTISAMVKRRVPFKAFDKSFDSCSYKKLNQSDA